MIHKGTRLYKLIAFPGLLAINGFERAIVATRGNRTFYQRSDFPWISEVEKNWPLVQEELLGLLGMRQAIPEFKEISEEQARITRGEWRTHVFYAYGKRVARNCETCPETVRVLESIPGMTTGLLSILAPGAHLIPHRGPFKGVLRYHLGLIVPPEVESCAIRVGPDMAHWREGESLVFDDTHEHEAWNRSDQLRAVLFVDFIRDLPFPLAPLNRAMIRLIGASPFVQNMMAKLNEWNDRVSDVR